MTIAAADGLLYAPLHGHFAPIFAQSSHKVSRR